jgi:6-phosphogluconolactonase (cycloisomerase 2 family)
MIMRSTKLIKLALSIFISLLITCLAQTAKARSVYVITNIGAGTVKAYSIQDDEIEYQATAENLQRHGDGAVGLALDPDSEILFVTYESSNIIEMVNAKTMLSEENPVIVYVEST